MAWAGSQSNKTLPKVLTDEELAAIYSQINEGTNSGCRNRALLQVMADAALRVGETVRLQTQDLTYEGGRVTAITVREGKNGKSRTVFVTPQLSDKLLRWLDARRALGITTRTIFCQIKHALGEPMSVRNVQQIVGRLGVKAKLEKHVTPHQFRHAAATRKLRSSGNLRVVQDQLGHSRLDTTQIYTHIVDPERQAAAENLPPVDGQEQPVVEQSDDSLEEIFQSLSREQRLALAKKLVAMR